VIPIRSLVPALAVCLGAATPSAAEAGVPPGYYVDSTHASEVRPTWRDARDGEYTFSIRRTVEDSVSARLLGIAEAVYPPRELLITLAVNGNHEMGSDTSGVPLWWSDGPGMRRIPYAVTAGAILHYWDLTEELRTRTLYRPGVRRTWESDFDYEATIAARDTFVVNATAHERVYVAHLRLEWSYDDGTFYSLVQARRTVVLRGDGEVLEVEGDGGAVEETAISGYHEPGRVRVRHR
jgi:hypothetical protein